jgi:threonine aldolase
VLTRPGMEVIAESACHMVRYERGAPGVISGVLVRTIDAPDGQLDPAAVQALIGAGSEHTAQVGLVWLENTHNGRGGRVVPLENVTAVARVAHDAGIPAFLDGARIFNASVASGTGVAEYAAQVDALSFCFSKGLGAPIGSMVLGTRELIGEVRHVRQMLGGGMRQVGVICAAARVAIDTMVDRLADDHANARRLAEGFADALPGCVDPSTVETNMVFVDVGDRDVRHLVATLAEDGVRVAGIGGSVIRAVTHKDVTRDGIERAAAAFRRAVVSGETKS